MKTMKMTALVLGVGVAAFAAGCGQGDVDGGGSAHPDERATGEAAVAAPAKPVSDALPAGYVHVPNGVVAHQDCVHEIPNGASVDLDGNVTLGGKLVAHFDACTHPITRGKRPDGVDRDKSSGLDNPPGPSNWIEATWTNAPANDEFISSTSTFKVPAAPSKDNGQIVYLFPSIQGGGGIVQPAWTYASWGVTSSNVYHSTGITVNAGDTLESQMVAWSQSNNFISWEIVATDQTTGGQTWAVVDFADGTSLWNNAQAAVLEAYGLTSCSNFPSTRSRSRPTARRGAASRRRSRRTRRSGRRSTTRTVSRAGTPGRRATSTTSSRRPRTARRSSTDRNRRRTAG